MEIVSLIISILAILGSLYVYFSHDRKLKKQESKLNELQLSEIKESKEDRMKAIVRMNTSYSSKGNGILYLFNEGKAEARNISWLFDNDILEKINKEGTYERLSPGQRIGFNYYLLSGKDYKTNVTITWKDDFSLSNKINMTLFALNQAY